MPRPQIRVDGPDPIDIHVGARVRNRRKEIGISQKQLAESYGVTFQQTQKGERGINRFSASALYKIAKTLGVSVNYFFDGLAPLNADGASGIDRIANAVLVDKEVRYLVGAFLKLEANNRKFIGSVIKGMVP
jgi:transcriptional regulator with XRE-family HTH domain